MTTTQGDHEVAATTVTTLCMTSSDPISDQERVTPATVERSSIAKTIFGSPAGKKRLAKRLAALLPAHRTYVEPFAGSAAVLFAKEPSPIEVINDIDPEIVSAYRSVKSLRPEDYARLERFEWLGSEEQFHKVWAMSPRDELEKLYRFLYIARFSYGKMRGKGFNTLGGGQLSRGGKRLKKHQPRLQNVRVYGGDYERVVRKFDGKDTVFYLDPPYPGYEAHVGEERFDETRFLNVLKSIKGKFLLTYGIRGRLTKEFANAGFHVRRIRVLRSIGLARNAGGPNLLTQLVVTNYMPTQKALDALRDCEELDDGDEVQPRRAELAKAQSQFAKPATLIKNVNPNDERFVLGVVLEPETVDAQGDIYSAEEVRKAAHRFMEEFQGLGLQHRERVNGDVRILESYLAPDDVAVGGVPLKKGTWLLGVRVVSDELWRMVKDGELSGFSIGGSARKIPEVSAE